MAVQKLRLGGLSLDMVYPRAEVLAAGQLGRRDHTAEEGIEFVHGENIGIKEEANVHSIPDQCADS